MMNGFYKTCLRQLIKLEKLILKQGLAKWDYMVEEENLFKHTRTYTSCRWEVIMARLKNKEWEEIYIVKSIQQKRV